MAPFNRVPVTLAHHAATALLVDNLAAQAGQ